MTIIKEKNMLLCGSDFVDCVAGKYVSHGWVEINNGLRFDWKSTLNQDTTCAAIRAELESCRLRAVAFMSQAI